MNTEDLSEAFANLDHDVMEPVYLGYTKESGQ